MALQSYFWPRPEGEGVSHYGSKMESVLGTAPAFLQGATVTEASDTSLSMVSKKVQGKRLAKGESLISQDSGEW